MRDADGRGAAGATGGRAASADKENAAGGAFARGAAEHPSQHPSQSPLHHPSQYPSRAEVTKLRAQLEALARQRRDELAALPATTLNEPPWTECTKFCLLHDCGIY